MPCAGPKKQGDVSLEQLRAAAKAEDIYLCSRYLSVEILPVNDTPAFLSEQVLMLSMPSLS